MAFSFWRVVMNKLKEVRFFKGVTQWELAKASQIPQGKISLIENGYVKASDEEKRRLAKALRVSPEEIWGGNGDR